ncbi:hypothetical protein CXF83_17505 [Shewanella sp. Choline-02u-19]|nr:hypothetical protein CXF82_11475 [Shewanella sp. GutDb-MelDb]PKG76388.1 hypothetical protein CXF86_02680 [Shewanella sp. GutCb]PKH57509.1 hypothetical protein CXF84_07755 [Shewanella sp. Bg11-22]PKI28371.1 hypothetical protein CXF83_17505 [Shewanella sp. Choline-02u-19]
MAAIIANRAINCIIYVLILGAVDLSRLFLPPFIGYFDKAEAMSFSHSPQIAYNTVKIAKKRGP